MTQAIVYTKTDESPMMSTYSLFPIFESFLSKAGIAQYRYPWRDASWLDFRDLEEEQRRRCP